MTDLLRYLHARLSVLSDQRGQTMAEYGILLGVIAIVVVAAAILLGGSITDIFNKTSAHL